jgi:MFS family permease
LPSNNRVLRSLADHKKRSSIARAPAQPTETGQYFAHYIDEVPLLPVCRERIDEAVTRGILSPGQADDLWTFLSEQPPLPERSPGFSFTNVLYYFGGIMAIGAMTLFMTIGWEAFGGWGIFSISIVYAMLALAGTRYLQRKGYPTPAGILAALAVSLVPLAIYGLQQALKMWPETRAYRDYHVWIDWRWAIMEIGTLVAGGGVLYVYRLPFVVMPLSVTLWYMSMDFAPLLAPDHSADLQTRKLVSIAFGIGMIALAILVDSWTHRRPDYAFWLYIFGTLAFWGGLSSQDSGSELGKFVYALINVAMIFLGAVLARRIFTVCGGLGAFGYLGYLSYTVFKDSILFPIALTALGLGLVGAGLWWQRHEGHIRMHFRGMLPAGLRDALENAA